MTSDKKPLTYVESSSGFVPPKDKQEAHFVVPTEQGVSKPDIDVYWVPQSVFEDRGYPFARGLAVVGGSDILLNSLMTDDVGHMALHHELSHCFGHRHGDGGIVNYLASEGKTMDTDPSVPLAKPTIEPARKCVGLRYLTWGMSALSYMTQLYASSGKPKVSAAELGHGVKRYAGGGQLDDVFYASGYERFGGVLERGRNKWGELKLLTGRFYGLPTTG